VDVKQLSVISESEMLSLGARLGRALRAGDTVSLTGGLGAGKTTLARGLVQSVLPHETVPSPTYTLVQNYVLQDFTLWHCDLYRLEHPDEAYELGLMDAMGEDVCLLEWPDRLGALLAASGWGDANVESFPGDASSRRYFRLTRGEEVAVLMDAPRGAETPAEPEGATVAEREALGYNALARLAGPEPAAFACLSNELVIRGFSAPKIIAADLQAGLLLLEDFGQGVYAKVIQADPAMEASLYSAAVECLAEIYRSSFPAMMSYRDAAWRVRDYDEAALLTETHLFLDWYAADKGAEIAAAARLRLRPCQLSRRRSPRCVA